jgi:SAM-dependent methyltransferase
METTPRRLTFGAHAAEYELARPAWPVEVARWFVPEDATLVVELGAGTGKLTRALAELGLRVVAVEPDERMRAVLQGNVLDGVEGSAEEIPCADGSAGAVVAGSAIHWFDLERALPEIHRVLRPGGRLGFGWNHRDTEHPTIAAMSEIVYGAQGRNDGGHWTTRDWAGELTASGLFGDVERKRFEHVHEIPRAALEAHLLSYAGVAALPADVRDDVFSHVAEVLDSDRELSHGERLRLPFAVHAFRARRL